VIKNAAVVLEALPNKTLLSKSLANATGVGIIGVGNK
jgi:hypothetical protein